MMASFFLFDEEGIQMESSSWRSAPFMSAGNMDEGIFKEFILGRDGLLSFEPFLHPFP